MIRLTDEHREIRDMVADFSRQELAPRAEKVDADAAFPQDALAMLSELGILGAPIPEKYNGSGGDALMLALILEELAFGCGATATMVATHVAQSSLAILDSGTDEQRERHLPALAAGERFASFAFAETGVESDAAAMACRARRDGDDWIIDGHKRFVIGGEHAELLLVAARTEDGRDTEPLALFLVEGGASASGVQVGRMEECLGLRGAGFTEVVFDGCRLPGSSLLGDREKNFGHLRRVLEMGRLSVAAIACGVGRSAVDYARHYASQREAFGQTIDRFQAIRALLAAAATRLEAARLLTYRGASRRDRGEDTEQIASMAKLFATDSAYQATKDAVQILGGNGYSREYPVERMYRDAKTLEVAEASAHVHEHLIAGSLIGER